MTYTLQLLKLFADGISVQFGYDCEVTIYKYGKTDNAISAVYILNGHVTTTHFGDTPPASIIEQVKQLPLDHLEPIESLAHTPDGRSLKSSTIVIPNETGDTIDYLLIINYDITHLMAIDRSLKALVRFKTPQLTTDDTTNIDMSNNSVNNLLERLIEQSVELIGKPAALMSKSEKIIAITYLNKNGAFLITKAGDKISKYFGLSKYTLYGYIDVNHHKSNNICK